MLQYQEQSVNPKFTTLLNSFPDPLPMKIAIVGTFIGQKTSGAEISSIYLARNLSQSEDVFIITAKQTHLMPVRCHSLPLLAKVPNPLLLIGNPVLDKYMTSKIYNILKKEKPDFVHIQDASILIATYHAAKKLNIPTVFTIRDYRFLCNLSVPLEQEPLPFQYTKQNYKRWLAQTFQEAYNKPWLSTIFSSFFYQQNNRLVNSIKHMDYYITVSDYVREQVIRSGIAPENVTTIRVQKEEWDYSPISNRKENKKENYTLFTAGGLKATKGFDYLLRSFRPVVDSIPNAQLRIAGDGSAKQKLLTLTKELHLEHNVTFLGQIPHEQMRQEYENAAFVISPSLWPEPLTRIIFEAFSARKTIVATNVGGTQELVIHGQTGLLVPPKNCRAMASAIMHLLNNPTVVRTLSKNAYELINKEGNETINYRRHIELYQKILTKQRE